MHRRGFLLCLTGIIAAPAIVKASSLMTLRGVMLPPEQREIDQWIVHAVGETDRDVFDFATIGLDEDEYDATIGAIANNARIIVPKRPILVA